MKTLFDRGVLFLLSSSQMVESKGTEKLFFALLFTQFSVVSVEHLLVPLGERLATKKTKQQKPSAVCVLEKRGRLEKNLQALFIFQESRIVVKYCKYYSLCFLMASVLRDALKRRKFGVDKYLAP